MTLRDVISQLETLHDRKTVQTIYAERVNNMWTPESICSIITEPKFGRLGDPRTGKYIPPPSDAPDGTEQLEYFLEISIAREAVDHYAMILEKDELTVEEKLRAIIYYAENDCPLGE